MAAGDTILTGTPKGTLVAARELIASSGDRTLPAPTAAEVLAAPARSGATPGGLCSVVRQTGAALGVAAVTALLGPKLGASGTAPVAMAGAPPSPPAPGRR